MYYFISKNRTQLLHVRIIIAVVATGVLGVLLEPTFFGLSGRRGKAYVFNCRFHSSVSFQTLCWQSPTGNSESYKNPYEGAELNIGEPLFRLRGCHHHCRLIVLIAGLFLFIDSPRMDRRCRRALKRGKGRRSRDSACRAVGICHVHYGCAQAGLREHWWDLLYSLLPTMVAAQYLIKGDHENHFGGLVASRYSERCLASVSLTV